MNSDESPVIVDNVFPVPPATLWKAITDPAQMREWFFQEIESFEPTVGFESRFNVHHEGKDYPHVWKIIEVKPESRIVYDWSYVGIPGEATVEWDLSEHSGGTKLVLTAKGHATFPQDDPLFQRESCVGGWEYFILEQLPIFIAEQDE